MMNIELKHNISKTVYFVKSISTPIYKNCDSCLGEGVLYRQVSHFPSHNNPQIVCPDCKGNKTYSDSGSIKEVVKKGIIDHIQIDVSNNGNINHDEEIDICYYIENDDIESEYVKYDEIYEDKLYDTYEEAESHIHKNYICGYTS